TEEAVEDLRVRIGVERVATLAECELKDRRYTRSYIKEVAMTIGDYNPLYLDLEYALKSPYGTIIAPPGVLQEVEQINAGGDGMPGMHALFMGLTLQWKQPLTMGSLLHGKTYLRNVEVKNSRLSGQMVVQLYESIGTTETGQVIGSYWTSWSRHERAATRGSKAESKLRPLASYTPEELERIRQDYNRETRRGAEPHYWDDVEIGEEVPHIVTGPTTRAQRMVGESAKGAGVVVPIGSGGDWGVAHAQAWKLYEKHPALPFINDQGIPDVPYTILLFFSKRVRVLPVTSAGLDKRER
ncbi:MaoC family dehydratase N-terminal domain-containing protein, partial [Chloroflexota bacterium]